MNQPQKFLFETSFETPGDAAESADRKKPALQYSEEDLERARAEGYAAGREAGQREVRQSLEQASSEAVDRVAKELSGLVEALAHAQERQHTLAMRIALAIERKLFPRMVEKHGPAEIEAVVSECLDHLRSEPRIVVRVADQLLDRMKDKVSALAERHGFEGRLVFLAEESLGSGDVRVEWADGGAERDGDWLWRQIDEAVERALDGPAAAGGDATRQPSTDDAAPSPAGA